MKLDPKEYEIKMKKTVEVYEYDLSLIRAGRANPALLDKINVDYYGAPTQINAMAQIQVTDARTISITPWDSSTLKSIEHAIQSSDIGINPVSDGKVIRLSFPQPTEERRKELTKQVSKLGEEAKVAIRNIRRDANEKCKMLKKDNEMTEDEQKSSEKIIQDLTDKYIKEIDGVTASKTNEIMSI